MPDPVKLKPSERFALATSRGASAPYLHQFLFVLCGVSAIVLVVMFVVGGGIPEDWRQGVYPLIILFFLALERYQVFGFRQLLDRQQREIETLRGQSG